MLPPSVAGLSGAAAGDSKYGSVSSAGQARPGLSSTPGKQLIVLRDDGPKRGWLTKRGQIFKTWHKRFFVLRAGGLHYYYGPDDLKPIGTIPLYGAAVILAHPNKTGGRANCLEVSTPSRTLWAYADDLTTAIEWARAVEREAIKASLVNAPRLPVPAMATTQPGSAMAGAGGYGTFNTLTSASALAADHNNTAAPAAANGHSLAPAESGKSVRFADGNGNGQQQEGVAGVGGAAAQGKGAAPSSGGAANGPAAVADVKHHTPPMSPVPAPAVGMPSPITPLNPLPRPAAATLALAAAALGGNPSPVPGAASPSTALQPGAPAAASSPEGIAAAAARAGGDPHGSMRSSAHMIPTKTLLACGYCNCLNASAYGCDGFCAKHFVDMTAMGEDESISVKKSGIFGFGKKKSAPVPHHSLKFTNELKDKWIDSGNEVVFKDLPRLAKRMSVWTQQTGLCVDCGRKVHGPSPADAAAAAAASGAGAGGADGAAPNGNAAVAYSSRRLEDISVWTAICNVVLAVSIYLEADEKKIESIFTALQTLGKGLKSRDADLAPLCEELFTKHVGLRSKTFAAFRAAHQSALLPAVFYLQKEVVKPESYGILKDVQRDFGWRILFSLSDKGVTVTHMRWAQSTDPVQSPKHFQFAWDVRMLFPLDLSNMSMAHIRIETLQLHEQMAADRRNALTALLMPSAAADPNGSGNDAKDKGADAKASDKDAKSLGAAAAPAPAAAPSANGK